MMENRALLILISLIVVAGAWLRLSGLGTLQLSGDELPYHFAAQAQQGTRVDGAAPPTPPGTYLARGDYMIGSIATVRGIVPDPGISARLPSAVIGTLAIPLFAALVWLIAGPWAALVATFMLAFYPEAIRQSRTAGLYSTQQAFGIVALSAGWLATARAGPQSSSTPVDLIRRWLWAGVCLVSFMIAGLAHLSAATVFAGFAIWVLLLAVLAIWIGGVSAVLNNLAVQLVIAGILGVIAVFVAKPDVLSAIAEKITSTPFMLVGTVGAGSPGPGFYLFALATEYAWAFTLLPLLALLVLRKYTWLGIYLVLWFIVPLVAHSFFIARKEERLLLLATPALFLLAGVAVHAGRESLVGAVNLYAREWLPTYRSVVRAGYGLAWFVLLSALITLPALMVSIRVPSEATAPTRAEWWVVRGVLGESTNAESVPLGSDDPLAALLYMGRVDFGVGTLLRPVDPTQATAVPPSRFTAGTDSLPRESRAGVHLAPNIGQLTEAYLPYGEVHVVVDSRSLESGSIDTTLRAALLERATELCRGRCGSLRLYKLRLSG